MKRESHKDLKFRDYLAVRFALSTSRDVTPALVSTEDINKVLSVFYTEHPEYAQKGKED